MPKFMIQASYTAEGLRGVMRDKASGRKAAVENLASQIGGKVEAVYFVLGEDDVIVLLDCPDNATAAALSATVSASGLVRAKTIPLLTVEEMDQGLSRKIQYKAPGA